MAQRFFKTHPIDGKIFFRASGSNRTFLSARFDHSIGFSSAAPAPTLGWVPVVEIEKAEYNALVAAKKARVIAAGGDTRYQNKPSDSWVAAAETEADAPDPLDDFNYAGSRHHY